MDNHEALSYLKYGRVGKIETITDESQLHPGWLAKAIAEVLKPFSEQNTTK